jgi:hypothetical protein
MSRLENLALESGIEDQTKFEVGKVIVTRAASAALEGSGQTLAELLARHQAGDWGDVADHVRAFNERALVEKFNLQSVYNGGHGQRLVVATNRQRAVTMVHLDRRAKQVSSPTARTRESTPGGGCRSGS